MKTFEFYQDQKVTAWDRVHFSVTAMDIEDAKAKLTAFKDKEVEDDDILGIKISDLEAQYETSEPMTVAENGGCATLEIFTEAGEDVMDNTPEPCSRESFHCSECGSTNVQIQAWVDPNNNNSFVNSDDEEGWCDSCEQHFKIIPRSELMKDIEYWWEHLDNGEDREVITGLVTEDYDPANDYQAFDEACDEVWSAKTDDEKIEIWQTLTQRGDDNDE